MAKKDHIKDLSRILHFYQQTGYLCDTILVAEDGDVKVHSPVLAAASSVFRKSLKHGSSPTLHVIVLPGVDHFVAKAIVHFVYTGVVVVPVKYVLAGQIKTVVKVLKKLQLISESEAQIYLSKDVLSKVLLRTPASSQLLSIHRSDIQSSDATAAKSSEVPCTGISGIPQSVIETNATVGNSITSNSALHSSSSSVSGVLQMKKTCVTITTGLTLTSAKSSVVENGQASASAGNMQSSNDSDTIPSGNSLTQNVSSDDQLLSESNGKPWKQRTQVLSSKTDNDIQTDRSSPTSVCDLEVCWFCGGLHRHQPSFYCDKAAGINVSCGQQNLRFNHLCEYCGKVLVNASNYKIHVATHMRKETNSVRDTYPCEKCGRILSSLGGVRMHSQRHHKKYVCDVCSASYVQLKSLKQHQLDRHGIFTKSRHHPDAFQCSVCLRRFACRQKFNTHLLCHTGETPHACELCARRFSTKKALQYHLMNHIGHKYRCQECGFSFSNKSAYYVHIKREHKQQTTLL